MDFLSKKFNKAFFLLLFTLNLSGCQLGYYVKSATGQISLLAQRNSIEKALQDSRLSPEQKRKLKLAQSAYQFAVDELKLKKSGNYQSYVHLDRSHVTYVVSAAPKWELNHYIWNYPIVGKMPYKGFFNEADAKLEEQELRNLNLDTYLRGVSAFSTLGWFDDPILSSMLNYKDHDLVNTIIHETVHATLYIKNSSDFNERMAVFLGTLGMEMYYKKQEGDKSETLKKVADENSDEMKFSQFISNEIKSLDQWYKDQKDKSEPERQVQFQKIKQHFHDNLLPELKSEMYKNFENISLNNARLLIYKTYVQDLSDFKILFEKNNKDIQKFLDQCRSLEKHPNPEQGLKELIR